MVFFFQDHLSTSARTMKTTTSKHNLKEKLKVANQYLQKLKSLSHEVDACTYLKTLQSLSLI